MGYDWLWLWLAKWQYRYRPRDNSLTGERLCKQTAEALWVFKVWEATSSLLHIQAPRVLQQVPVNMIHFVAHNNH